MRWRSHRTRCLLETQAEIFWSKKASWFLLQMIYFFGGGLFVLKCGRIIIALSQLWASGQLYASTSQPCLQEDSKIFSDSWQLWHKLGTSTRSATHLSLQPRHGSFDICIFHRDSSLTGYKHNVCATSLTFNITIILWTSAARPPPHTCCPLLSSTHLLPPASSNTLPAHCSPFLPCS